MSDSSIPKETDWIVGTLDGQIIYHATSKKLCLEWLGRKHKRNQTPGSHKVVDGVYDLTLDDHTYWLMNGAPTARVNGYDIPLPEIPETYGLTAGQAALVRDQRGPALVWVRHGDDKTVHRQAAPADVDDLDAWAARVAARLTSYRVTYLGPREIAA